MENILRYNWLDILQYCEYDCDKILRTFYFFHNKAYLTKKDFFIQNILNSKHEKCNYILNIKALLEATVSKNKKCVYLDLASQRNYIDYLLEKNKNVPIMYASKYDLEILKTNPLIIVEDNYIKLKFE